MAVTPEKIRKILYETRDPREGYYVFLQETYRSHTKPDGELIRLRLPGSCGSVVHPETEAMRKELPEAYRGREYECISVYARHELTEGRPDAVKPNYYFEPDLLYGREYRNPWKVVRTKQWEEYGFWRALAVRRRKGVPA